MPRKTKFTPPDREELLRRLDVESRGGSVTATKALLEELRRDADDEDSGSGFDALDAPTNVTPIASRRRGKAS